MTDMSKQNSVAAALQDLIALAGREYEYCQLSAQQADIEGHELAAAVLRSIAETYTGTAHTAIALVSQLEGAGTHRTTRHNLASATLRGGEVAQAAHSIAGQLAESGLGEAGSTIADAAAMTEKSVGRLQHLLTTFESPQKPSL